MTELRIDAKLQEASRRSTAFAVRNQAEQALARPLTIRAADQTFAVGNAESFVARVWRNSRRWYDPGD